MRAQKVISGVTGLLVLGLAVAAFALSFSALRSLAASNGIAPGSAWVFPLIVDGAMIVFSLSILRNSLYSESAAVAWGFVVVFMAASIIFNVLHAEATPQDPLRAVIAAVAPVALFLAFETLMRQIRSEVERRGSWQSLEKIMAKVDQAQAELDALLAKRQTQVEKLDTSLEKRRASLSKINQELRELRKEKSKLVKELEAAPQTVGKDLSKPERLDFVLGVFGQDPLKDVGEVAQSLGVSNQTVYNYLAELEKAAKIRRNGQGVEVLAA